MTEHASLHINPPQPPFTSSKQRGGFADEKGGQRGIIFLLLVFCFLFLSCGSTTLTFDYSVPTQSNPYVHRLDPANAKAGDAVTIFGFGFSVEVGRNIVTFGSTSTFANNYSVVIPAVEGEIESLTVTVPQGVTAGDTPVFVTVFDNTSNTNLSITINP